MKKRRLNLNVSKARKASNHFHSKNAAKVILCIPLGVGVYLQLGYVPVAEFINKFGKPISHEINESKVG